MQRCMQPITFHRAWPCQGSMHLICQRWAWDGYHTQALSLEEHTAGMRTAPAQVTNGLEVHFEADNKV